MRDGELKRLSRTELVDIIYEQQKRLEECERELGTLREQLSQREIRMAEAGSVAEAALKLNGVFEAAQSAADQYLASIRSMEERTREETWEAESRRRALLRGAEAEAAEILLAARRKASRTLEDAPEGDEDSQNTEQGNAAHEKK